jgi:microcystin degradation protein MlrC
MRIAVGQLWQETNTFNPNHTRLNDFNAMGVSHGSELLEKYSETGELSGFLKAFRKAESASEFVGLSRFACWPWGALEAKAWQSIRQSFEKQFKKAGSVDAVYLTLHGAMCSEDEPDVTGALLQLVRDIVGKDVPIVGSLDLHANITPLMLQTSDVLAGYHACPHIDGVETGARAAKALQWCLKTGRRPVTYSRKLPMITAAESHNTFTGTPSPLYRRLGELERQRGVLTAGLYMAMPWFDCPELGWTATLTVTDDTPQQQSVVDDLAEDAWSMRSEMENIQRLLPADVVEAAQRHSRKPIVIGDGADATNSGAPGDDTTLLRELLRRENITGGALTFLVDASAVAEAQKVGEGNVFDFPIGGKLSSWSSPVRVHGTVRKLLDVKWILDGHIANNLPIDMGRGAVVVVGDVVILLCERTGPGSSPKLYECAGLDPRKFGIVIAKSPSGFRADYSPFAGEIYLADCPGCASPRWSELPFIQVTRPLWPLDTLSSPNQATWCGPLRTGGTPGEPRPTM